MAVNLSPIWGAGAQLLDNSGNVLSGGKIYTYAAGTTTQVATYTSNTGATANSNPIILNSAGRVPYEIWLTDGQNYKFVLKDSNDVLIGTWDNLSGINSNFIAYTNQQEIQTATAGQTVFNLTTMNYLVGTNSLSVFVDGVNQYGPGAQYAYEETDSNTVTFASGLHVGAEVKFTSSQIQNAGAVDASQVSYDPPFTNSVATNVEAKLAQYVSVKDFGATGDGVTDDSDAIRNAVNAISTDGGQVYFPAGTYKVTAASGDTSNTAIYVPSYVRITGASQVGTKIIPGANNTVVFRMVGMNGGIENLQINNPSSYTNVSGIRVAPIDETQTTTHTDTEFNEVTNVSIRSVAEAIVLKCGPRIGGQDSYCYYNTFTNIDIRNCTLGIWLKVPNTTLGSGCNRNTFISCRVGETGTNTGLKIDAGDTNKFIACSFEGIQSGTSPNATPTAIQIAYNTVSYGCVNNQFYGLIIEACTRDMDNDNDETEVYGWFHTGSYYSPSNRPLSIEFSNDTGLNTLSSVTGTSMVVNGASALVTFNPSSSATRKAVINTTSGGSNSYNGVLISSNCDSSFAQVNTSLPSWNADIGGAVAGSSIGVADSFGIQRKAAGGGSYTQIVTADNAGAWKPGTDNTQSLGTGALRWSVVYAGTGTINTSDANEKTEIVHLSDAEKRVALHLKTKLKRFKFKDAIEKKGNKARYHFGIIAQEVKAAFHVEGLDAEEYGLFCFDTLEDGSIRLGVRYEELLAFIIGAI